MDGYASVQLTPENPPDLLLIILTSRAQSVLSLLGWQAPASLPRPPTSPSPPPSASRHSRSLTITEMWRMCICSSTISEGSWSVGAVARASWPALLMETWKYKVPFSSHCCLQCTSEMSAAVPDISARQDRRRWVSGTPGLGIPGREGATRVQELRRHLLCTIQDAFPYIESMGWRPSLPL